MVSCLRALDGPERKTLQPPDASDLLRLVGKALTTEPPLCFGFGSTVPYSGFAFCPASPPSVLVML